MDECLKKAAEARKHAISLGSLEYSGDLASQLMTFSAKLEKVFKLLQEKVQRKVDVESEYTKLFNILRDKFSWFEKAEAGWCTRNMQSVPSQPVNFAKQRFNLPQDIHIDLLQIDSHMQFHIHISYQCVYKIKNMGHQRL